MMWGKNGVTQLVLNSIGALQWHGERGSSRGPGIEGPRSSAGETSRVSGSPSVDSGRLGPIQRPMGSLPFNLNIASRRGGKAS